MTERERALIDRCHCVQEDNRALHEEKGCLYRGLERTFERLCRKERECLGLREANADLRGKLGAAYALLGEAIDELPTGSDRPQGRS